jgi:hypothetical protein
MNEEGLPKRGAVELAAALRKRAEMMSGEHWEVPATQAMMREAAQCLEAATRPCKHCESTLVSCYDWKRAGKVACCPECDHRLIPFPTHSR